MATRPKAVIESRNGEKFSPITIAKNVLTDDGQNLHDILSDRKEDMMTPTIENSSSMFKVGQGDNVDYSENVVDGAYESLVFKGKSLVNLLTSLRPDTHSAWVRNGSSFTLNASGVVFLNYTALLKPNTTYTVVGELDFDVDGIVIGFREGNKSWEVSRSIGSRGRFAVLISTSAKSTSNALTVHREVTANSDRVTLSNLMVLEGDWTNKELPPYFEGICDCKSPILTNVGKNLFDGVSYIDGFIASGNNYTVSPDTDVTSILVNVNKNTDYILSAKTNFDRSLVGGSLEPISIGTKTTNLNAERISNTIKFNSGEYTNVIIYLNSSKIDIEDIQVEEGSVSTTYEPYKSNILSCNGDKIELTEDMFEQGSLFYERNTFEEAKMQANNDTGTRSIRIRTKKLIKVKPNTTYRFSYTNSCQSWFYGYDMNENPTNNKSTVVGATEQVFTTSANTHFLAFVLFKTGNPNVTPSDYDYKSIQIREVDKTIVLRSLPNGVCDTLNVETGEYVQRIGEVNTKSLQTTVNLSTGAEANVVFVNGINGKFIGWNECNVASDKLQWTYRADTNWSKSSSINGIAVEPNGGFWFIVDKTIETKEQANEFLVNLDATIQYELATPIVKQINVEGYPYAYENGHILLESGSQEQSLTPTIEYSIVANRGGQIRSNQRMVERHQKQLDRLQAMILTNLVNTQYEQTLTNLKYDLKNVREEVK